MTEDWSWITMTVSYNLFFF